MYSHLIVLTESVAGRDDDFNDWYTWVHIRDVMRMSPVVIAVQRFKRSSQQLTGGSSGKYPQNYFGIYENTDPPRLSADHRWVFTDEMPITTALSDRNVCEAYYDTLVARNKAPGSFPNTDVIVERIETGVGGGSFEDWYVGARFPALMQLPGMVSGFVGKAGKHQMLDHLHRPEYTCVYRTSDLVATLSAWKPCDAPVALERDEISVDCYTPLIARVTAIEVREPSPESAETARRKRAAMGDDVQKAAPSHFKWENALEKMP